MNKQVVTWRLNELAYKFIRPFNAEWLRERWSSRAATQATSNAVVSKVGIHCQGPARNGYGAFLQAVNDAGRRVPLIKCRDDLGAIDEPLALWPETVTIGAYTNWDDADYNVDTAYNRIVAAAQGKPGIKYWEYYNERDGEYKQQADLYIALMPRLAALGIGLCMFNCASGTPKTPSEDGGAAYAEIARACKFARDGGYKVVIGLHEYESSGGTIGRFKVLADYLEAHGALIPIYITEYGYEVHPGDNQFMIMIRANDPVYMADNRVGGCATWTLGGGGWGASNFASAFPRLGEYMATVEPITPPATDYIFDHWVDVATGANLGNANPLTFVIESDRNIKAVFVPKVPPVIMYTCQTSVEPSGAGVVTGGGTFAAGSTVTLQAVAA